MQVASTATKANVSYLAATGLETLGNSSAYAILLLQRQCDAIVTIGQTRADTVLQYAPRHPKVRFVLVAGKGGGANITTVATADTRSAVAQAIEQAVNK
jgi:DNA-binding LacI/PurR family transcriptional regulator